jgi:hypothetical protein
MTLMIILFTEGIDSNHSTRRERERKRLAEEGSIDIPSTAHSHHDTDTSLLTTLLSTAMEQLFMPTSPLLRYQDLLEEPTHPFEYTEI